MSTQNYSYFDEAYFQDGTRRGTAYVNYKEAARDSKTFKELAFAIQEIFQPRRVLDVGCATGITVRHLNERGCEAHGIDVSEWAVHNAEHPNVRLAAADALPFPDEHFDLVISCHSMEHLPEAVFRRSLSEITRVSSAFQFHMLPMVGTPPYDGEPETVRRELRKDPTHQQLHSKDFWLQRFQELGCIEVESCILLRHETSNAELSTGQFLLKKNQKINESEVLRRAASRNQRIFREVQLSRVAPKNIQGSSLGHLTLNNRTWSEADKKMHVTETINLMQRKLRLFLVVDGSSCALRFAAGQDISGEDYAHVGEFHFTAHPGLNEFTFSVDQLRTLRGCPDYSAINHLGLGGISDNANVFFSLNDQFGDSLLTLPSD